MRWDEFFDDMDLLEEIQKDIRRTRSELQFFIKPLDSRDLPTNDSEKARLEMQFETPYHELSPEDQSKRVETHADVLTRVLFIYAKLNPGVKYVQGMNEVLAVVYFVFWFAGSFMPKVELEHA